MKKLLRLQKLIELRDDLPWGCGHDEAIREAIEYRIEDVQDELTAAEIDFDHID